MKERPILFNGEMVRAILDGRKTQTRRVIKRNASSRVQFHGKQWHIDDQHAACACPYGQPGDRLWVRETWAAKQLASKPMPPFAYRATSSEEPPFGLPHHRWRPSIHMPRWASRITLEIESVRVERVQSISDFDAFQEGAKSLPSKITGPYCQSHVEGFRQLWDSINGARGFGWDVNPWVWVITFRRVK